MANYQTGDITSASKNVTISEVDLGGGIDKKSAENQIESGRVDDLVNGSTNAQGTVRKRNGYQRYMGDVPLRVKYAQELATTPAELILELDKSIAIDTSGALELQSGLQRTPILLRGTKPILPGGGLEWNTFWEVRERLDFPLSDFRSHAIEHTNILTECYVPTDLVDVADRSNSLDLTCSQIIHPDGALYITSSAAATSPHFVCSRDITPIAGSIWSGTTGYVSSFVISAATHMLHTANMQVIVEKIAVQSDPLLPDYGTNVYYKTAPTSVSIDASLNVTIALPSTATWRITLVALSHIVHSPSGVNDRVITIADSQPFIAISAIQFNGNARTLVDPVSVVYDAAAATTTVTFLGAIGHVAVAYDYLTLSTNTIRIRNYTSGDHSGGPYDVRVRSGNVNMDVYGLVAEGTEEGEGRALWVNHLDNYVTDSDKRPVCGMGGVLYRASTQAELLALGSKVDTLYPRLSNNLSSSAVIGPLFHDTGITASRTQGYITADNGGSHWLDIDSITGTATSITFTVRAPNWAVYDSANVLKGSDTAALAWLLASPNLPKYITSADTGYAENSGEFLITAMAVVDVHSFTITATRTTALDAQEAAYYNEPECGGRIGGFSDVLQLAEPLSADFPTLIPGDTVGLGEDVDTVDAISVLEMNGFTACISPVTDMFTLQTPCLISATRTSRVVPVWTAARSIAPSDIHCVIGDTLVHPNYARNLTVRDMLFYTDSDQIATNSFTVTIAAGIMTLVGRAKADLMIAPGATIQIYGDINDIIILDTVNTAAATPSEFTFTLTASTTLADVSGLLVRIVVNCIVLDEAITFTDNEEMTDSLTISGRWTAVEVPSTNDITTRTFSGADYDYQDFLRSVMVNDSMFLTNGVDDVMKYDGYNIYRAGLPRWNPAVFITRDATASGAISVPTQKEASVSTISGDWLSVGSSEDYYFAVGDKVTLWTSGGAAVRGTEVLTIREIDHDNARYLITPSGTNTTTAKIKQAVAAVYSYYFRLNAVDANDNVVASASCGSAGDYNIELDASTAIRLRLQHMLPWHIYDYSRLELEIYRTKNNGAPPYYHVATIPWAAPVAGWWPLYTADDSILPSYVDYIDTTSDDCLVDLDVVNSALLSNEVGSAWTEPPRAKCITTIGNRLILGNIRDYIRADLRFMAKSTASDIDFSTFNGTSIKVGISAGTYAACEFTTAAGLAVSAIAESTEVLPAVGAACDVTVTGSVPGTADYGWVYLTRTTAAISVNPRYAGWYRYHRTGTSTMLVYMAYDSAYDSATDIDRAIFAPSMTAGYIDLSLAPLPVYLGADYCYAQVAGNLDTSERINALRRAATALNVRAYTMIDGGEFIASAGADFDGDQLMIRCPRADIKTLTVYISTPYTDTYQVFCNDVLVPFAATRTISLTEADQRVMGSRILMSYPNFPEIFDSPFVELDKLSDSAIDINPADGQEITAIIPFFGISAFGAAITDAPLLVFKTNSVYVVDIASKMVKKLETRGLGCTFPRSVGSTRKGILFANDSGIYRISRDLSLEYVGYFLERQWQESTEKSYRDIPNGHHFAIGSEYKLSVPPLDEDIPDHTYVYDHTREDDSKGGQGEGTGAWCRWTNTPSLGWANLEADEFYATPYGRVMVRRRSGTAADFRDDDQPIPFALTTRAIDFGNPSIRKRVRRIVTHFRAAYPGSGTTLSESANLSEHYTLTDTFTVKATQERTGLSDIGQDRIASISATPVTAICQYIQLRYENSILDEGVEIAGIDFRVVGLDSTGMTEAADTSK